MKFKKSVIRLSVVMVMICLAILPGTPALALQGSGSATPAIVDVSFTTGSTWTVNGITGSGKIFHDTTYYSNPQGDTASPSATVLDNECLIEVDNLSNVGTDVYADMSHCTGGDASQNSDTGSNGVGEFGAYAYYSGMTFTNKVVAKTTGSDVLKSGLAATTDIFIGFERTEQSDAFASQTPMTFTYDISFVPSS